MQQIALSGASGRVGRCLAPLIEKEFSLLPLYHDETSLNRLQASSVDVLIDFSLPKATQECLKVCQEKKIPMVIGTTGFSEAEQKHIQQAAKVIPIVFAPNMSVGITLVLAFLKTLFHTSVAPEKILLSETHHPHKKDTPSGTARRIAELIKEYSSREVSEIQSHRVANSPGEHTLTFTFEGESLTLTHQAHDRLLYAKGALQAARWIIDKPPGLYDMQDVLGLT